MNEVRAVSNSAVSLLPNTHGLKHRSSLRLVVMVVMLVAVVMLVVVVIGLGLL